MTTFVGSTAATATVVVVLGIGATVVVGLALRSGARRSRSLRSTILLVSLAALVLALAAALIAARLMVLDDHQLGRFLVILGVAGTFAALLAVVIGGPLAADVSRLGQVATRIEQGDLTARTGIDRYDEIGHAAHALDQAVEQLDRLERERSGLEAERRMMLTSIGHDLRTPLAALQAAVEALADGVAPDPDRYLQAMQRDIVALVALVDDLFLLARIEAGTEPREHHVLDLGELADEAIEALAPMANDRDLEVRLEVDGAARTTGSPAELGRVIRNLLDNALRHTPTGAAVDIAVRGRDPVRLTVRDEGEGFPPEFVDEALIPFTRPDVDRNRTAGGSGLGLAIARGLVEAHGGRLRVQGGPGGTVVVELPGAKTG